jgi:UDP:flavonoid glycosyltransferase YjiC (YdhE family)
MPFAGHVGPLRPVAAELVARGHDVRVHTGRRYAEAFEAAGATVVTWRAAADFDEHDLAATFPAVQAGKGPRQLLANLRHVFVGTAAGHAKDLSAAWAERPGTCCSRTRPASAPALATELTGAPWASISLVPPTLPSRDLPPAGMGLTPGRGPLGRARDAVLRTVTGRAVDAALGGPYTSARREVGLPGLGPGVAAAPFSPSLVLALSVPELEHPRRDLPDHVHFVGRTQAPTPPRASCRPGGTRSCTPTARSSTSPRAPSTPSRPSCCCRRSRRWPTSRSWSWRPPAGAASAPKPEIAARVAWAGAGVDLRTGTPSATAVREAVRTVLVDQAYAAAATRIAAGFARHDGPRQVADLLEQLAEQREPVVRADAPVWA